VLGRTDLPGNPLFAANAERTAHAAALKDELESVFRTRTVAAWLDALEEAGIPCGPINTVDRVLDDPHVNARNMVVAVDDPEAGRVVMAGNPIKMTTVPDTATRPPAPDLDADRGRLLAEIGLD